MKPLMIQGIVLVLMLVALPLASLGTTNDTAWLNIAALTVFGLAALTPPAMRFIGDGEEDDDEEDGEDHDGEDGESHPDGERPRNHDDASTEEER